MSEVVQSVMRSLNLSIYYYVQCSTSNPQVPPATSHSAHIHVRVGYLFGEHPETISPREPMESTCIPQAHRQGRGCVRYAHTHPICTEVHH